MGGLIISFGRVFLMVILTSIIFTGVKFLSNKKKKKTPLIIILTSLGLILAIFALILLLGR